MPGKSALDPKCNWAGKGSKGAREPRLLQVNHLCSVFWFRVKFQLAHRKLLPTPFVYRAHAAGVTRWTHFSTREVWQIVLTALETGNAVTEAGLLIPGARLTRFGAHAQSTASNASMPLCYNTDRLYA